MVMLLKLSSSDLLFIPKGKKNGSSPNPTKVTQRHHRIFNITSMSSFCLQDCRHLKY